MELKAQIRLLNRQIPLSESEGLTVIAFYTDEFPWQDDFPWQRQEGLQIVILEAA